MSSFGTARSASSACRANFSAVVPLAVTGLLPRTACSRYPHLCKPRRRIKPAGLGAFPASSSAQDEAGEILRRGLNAAVRQDAKATERTILLLRERYGSHAELPPAEYKQRGGAVGAYPNPRRDPAKRTEWFDSSASLLCFEKKQSGLAPATRYRPALIDFAVTLFSSA